MITMHVIIGIGEVFAGYVYWFISLLQVKYYLSLSIE